METRSRLLSAAAGVIAVHGIEGASVDAIALAADRTSGSLYGQFGSKDALVFELLDHWRDEMAERTAADVVGLQTVDERLAALWRNFARPAGEASEWVRLEHELWRWATREGNADGRRRLADRYRDNCAELADGLRTWQTEGLIDPPIEVDALARVLLSALLGLEMQHRLDPQAVDEATVVRSLCSLVGAAAPPAATRPARNGSARPTTRTRNSASRAVRASSASSDPRGT